MLRIVLWHPNVRSMKSLPSEKNNARKALLYQPALQREKEILRRHQTHLQKLKVIQCCTNVPYCNIWPKKQKKKKVFSVKTTLLAG